MSESEPASATENFQLEIFNIDMYVTNGTENDEPSKDKFKS